MVATERARRENGSRGEFFEFNSLLLHKEKKRTMQRSVGICALAFGMATAVAAAAEPAGEGFMSAEGVTGRPVAPHGWVEENIYAAPTQAGMAISAQTTREPRGGFSWPADAVQRWSGKRFMLFTLSYDGIPAYSCTELPLPGADGAKATALHLDTPAHYSVMYNEGYHEWGEKPWIMGSDFYQTFVATTPHITRIAAQLADKSGDHYHLTLNYAVYATGDGPPSGWKRISPVRSRFLAGTVDPIIHIFHVVYRSEEVTLTPGKTYAIRLWRAPQSQSETFALVARPDRGDGYAGGCLYNGDERLKDRDAYAYVSGGSAGTVVNHFPLNAELKTFAGMGRRFGQTFKANGVGLAAADIVYTDGQQTPPTLPIVFQLYDRPDGQPIGPARTCRGLPLAYQGRAAVAWRPKEVPLVPGDEYYLEWSCSGCNTWLTNEDLAGDAYRDGKPMPGKDLMMSIVQYDASATTQSYYDEHRRSLRP